LQDELTSGFFAAIGCNPVIVRVLDRMRAFEAPDCWLVSGCLFQTVWNVLEGREPEHGILDYDLFYFDDSDLSYDAEDVWIRRAASLFADVGGLVELRNQARVHLWYPEKFGVAYPPLKSTCDGIAHFLAQACIVGVRPAGDRGLHLFAPLGLEDIFARVIRPNPLWPDGPKERLREKAARWRAVWPSLRTEDIDS
jgi:hypothetical protein